MLFIFFMVIVSFSASNSLEFFISLALVFAVVLVAFSIKYLGDKSLDYYSSYTSSFKVIKEVYTVQVAFGAVLAFVALLGMIIAGSSTSSSTASRFSNLAAAQPTQPNPYLAKISKQKDECFLFL